MTNACLAPVPAAAARLPHDDHESTPALDPDRRSQRTEPRDGIEVPRQDRSEHVNALRLLAEEEVLALLDAKHERWKRDREGWVTLERSGIMWRVHYCRGELVEAGWWGALEHGRGVQHWTHNVADRSPGVESSSGRSHTQGAPVSKRYDGRGSGGSAFA